MIDEPTDDLALIFWIGIYPKPFLNRIEPTVEVLLGRLERAGATRYLSDAGEPKAETVTKVAAR